MNPLEHTMQCPKCGVTYHSFVNFNDRRAFEVDAFRLCGACWNAFDRFNRPVTEEAYIAFMGFAYWVKQVRDARNKT